MSADNAESTENSASAAPAAGEDAPAASAVAPAVGEDAPLVIDFSGDVFTKEAKRFLIDTGYDPAFGARPLKRAIQREIEDPLAIEILEGKFAEGDHILIDHRESDRGMSFSRQ